MAATAPKTSSGTAPPPDTDTDTGKAASTGLSRAVIWTGMALGTALAVLAMTGGARLRIGGMPAWLGAVAGAVLVWALIVMASVTLAELTRRHHKTARRYAGRQGKRGALAAGRQGKRGALAAGRTARRGGRRLTGRAAAWAGPRWQARRHPPCGGQDAVPPGWDGADCPGCGRPLPADGTCPACTATPQDAQPDPAVGPSWSSGPEASREEAEKWERHMSGDGRPREAAGYPPGGGPGRTAATYVNGTPPTEGDDSMPASPSPITPGRRARRTAARAGGTVPGEWGPVIASAADFEPEDDADLLRWMNGHVNGMAGFAEGLIDAYETGVGAVGLDPRGLEALHDVADAAAHAAEIMAGARNKFTDYYELPREFAGNGGLMPHDGRWVTGEGG